MPHTPSKRNQNIDPWFLILLVLFLLIHGIRLFHPRLSLWDESVYLAMGKFLLSFGQQGLWEPIRPVLLPLLLAPAALLTPYAFLFFGKTLSLFFSTLLFFMLYMLTKTIVSRNQARIALLLLFFVPFFHQWTTRIMTSLPAATLGLGALWLFQRKRFFLAGLFSGFAFLMRYPAGLFLAGMLAAIVFSFSSWREKYQRLLHITGGFSLVVMPVLFLFLFFYGNPFAPFLLAAQHQANPFAAQSWYFYFVFLFHQAPFLLLGFLGLFSLKKKFSAGFFTLLFFLFYFHVIPNKQPRFLLLFLPLMILAAVFFLSDIFHFLKTKVSFALPLWSFFLLLLLLPSLFFFPQALEESYLPQHPLAQWYSTFDNLPQTTMITTEPLPAIFSQKRFLPCYNSWDDFRHCFNHAQEGQLILLTFYPFPEHEKTFYHQWMQEQSLTILDHFSWASVDYWLVRKGTS